MAAKKKPTRTPRVPAIEPSARHLWLASLGALVAVRRESQAALRRATGKVENTVADARYAVRRAEAGLRAGVEGVREQVAPKLACIGNEVEAQLAPVAARLGLKRKAKRAPRKPATSRPVGRRAARKPAARKPTRRPAKKLAG